MEPSKEKAPGQGGFGEAQNFQVPLSYPRRDTVKGRCLAALLRGEALTHLDCWRRFGSSRLAHHAWDLRQDGWPISTTDQTVPTSDGNRRAIIAVYELPAAAIAAAGEAGQRFAAGCLEARHDGAGR